MPAVFVHLSDIHFGQERDERVHIHNDVKEELIADAADVVRKLPSGNAHGIIVTGDIAQSGLSDQYKVAGDWLDRLAAAVGCEIFNIQLVPGNHDLDRQKLSIGATHVLDVIRAGGQSEYEKILANDADRASLFARFEDYARFCEGYDCPLDTEGRYATNLHVELAPDRAVRFVRMNSSLLCTGEENEKEPELMIGARQFTVPRAAGEEMIVLIHHPLNWFKDCDEATTYLQSRVRVLISGHEHDPKVNVERVDDDAEMMMLAAGATVPFKSNDTYTFTYNIIEFDWDAAADALAVTIHPRAWNAKRTCFERDTKRLGGEDPRFVLASPNFKKGTVPVAQPIPSTTDDVAEPIEPVIEVVAALDSEGDSAMPPEAEGYRLVLLQFFRDLTEGERLKMLVALDAVDSASNQRMTQAVERRLLDWLVAKGRISEVKTMINDLIEDRTKGGKR